MTNDVTDPATTTATARTESILAAAAELLAEGGYQALTMRAIAQRSGMSPGLIYRYFTDKRDVFAALLYDNQQRVIAILDETQAESVADFLAVVAPPIIDQWVVVGRMADSYADPALERTEAVEQLLKSTRRQMTALEDGLRRAADAEGRALDPSPVMVRYVWFSLMGLAENLTMGWHSPQHDDLMLPFAIEAIARGIQVA